jgi:hypothetical protein
MMDSDDLDPTTELDLLGEEDWEYLVDEIELDDPAYQQDAALVADLFRQVTSEASVTSPIVPADPIDQLPEVVTDTLNSSNSYTATPETSHLSTSRKVWVVAGVVGVAAIALLGVWSCQNRHFNP